METAPTQGISSCTPCDTKRSRELVANLRCAPVFTDYQEAFRKATRLPLALRPVGAFQSPLVGAKQASAAIALLSGSSQSCAAYLRFEGDLEEAALAGAVTREFAAGIVVSLVPIRLGHSIVGFLQTGHVSFRRPGAARIEAELAQWRQQGVELPYAELQAAFAGTTIVERAKYAATISLLGIFADHLAGLVNQIVVTQTKAELPAVARARVYIEEHQTDHIALGDVARAVNMSAFYFCKVFRKVTGVTFVEYLARLRVERVRRLLLEPHMRISEAAFAAGFQSLSQFNRVFLRLAGEAPTDYRDRIHHTGAPVRREGLRVA